MTDPFFHNIPNERIARGYVRTARIVRYSLLATLICVAAGIWVDARWWLTALLPLAVSALFAYTSNQFRQEINRRVQERQHKDTL